MKIKHLALGTLFMSAVIAGCVPKNGSSNGQQKQVEAVINNSNEIIKSIQDDRQYKHFVLDNGLNVVVVSDPKTEKSAVSVNVKVGAIHAPKDRLGLPHFLEHMLFIASKKYPEVDGMSKFLEAHGGYQNAYTSYDHTNFYFDVNNGALETALDRYAQFFISPTLDKKYVDKERHAVNSEYTMKYKYESRRIGSVMDATINQDHYASKFSVGNLETLHNEDGATLLKDLNKLHEKYYIAPNMDLVLYGKESVDQLSALVKKHFEAVPTGDMTAIANQPNQPLVFLKDQLGVRINVLPLKDIKQLQLIVSTVSPRLYPKSKPFMYLTHILGHEGKGSILSHLKKQGLASALSAGSDVYDNQSGQFVISIDLTDKGLKEVDGVTSIVFDYIQLLKTEGLKADLYGEIKQVADLDFRFREKINPIYEAQNIAVALQHTPIKDVLRQYSLYSGMNIPVLKDILADFVPSKLRQVVVAKDLPVNRESYFYKTEYSIEPLNELLVNRLKHPQKNAALIMPKANPFIATDTKLRKSHEPADYPTKIIKEKGFNLWAMTDSSFGSPTASLRLKVTSPEADKNAKQAILLKMFVRLLDRSINETGYSASLAGLYSGISDEFSGFQLAVSGYQDKQALLLKTLLEHVKSFNPTQFDFDQVRDRLQREIKNRPLSKLSSQSIRRLSYVLHDIKYGQKELVNSVENITLSDLKQYTSSLFKKIHIDMLVYGNLSKEEALKIGNLTGSYLLTKDNRVDESLPGFVVLKEKVIREEHHFKHDDSVYLRYVQNDTNDMSSKAKYMLFSDLIGYSFFGELRTNQQLGYSVSVRDVEYNNYPGLRFYIQSPVASPEHIEKSINKFLSDEKIELTKMTEKKLSVYKDSLVKKILKKDYNSRQKSAYFWNVIADHKTDFYEKKKLAKQVEKLTVKDMQQVLSRVAQHKGEIVVVSPGKKKENVNNI